MLPFDLWKLSQRSLSALSQRTLHISSLYFVGYSHQGKWLVLIGEFHHACILLLHSKVLEIIYQFLYFWKIHDTAPTPPNCQFFMATELKSKPCVFIGLFNNLHLGEDLSKFKLTTNEPSSLKWSSLMYPKRLYWFDYLRSTYYDQVNRSS